ncbi:MAG TPA: hypothetical protein VFF52_29860 [Isosphaeraceae bacterium]|nr:hypothetical protein [Isosphaeraceae bacterium]
MDQRYTKLGAALTDLDVAWRDRLDDALALLNAGRHASAILMGLYALEINLKARICRRLDLQHLPRAFEVHDLEGLLLLAGLSKRLSAKRAQKTLDQWDSIVEKSARLNELRYAPASRWTAIEAQTFFTQLNQDPDGVLPWLQRQK